MSETHSYRTHRSELKLGPDEADYLTGLAGCSRWAFNWALARQEIILKHSQNADCLMTPECLKRQLTLETEKPGNEWLKAAPRDVLDNALDNLTRAYTLYLSQCRQNSSKGYVRNPPKHKRRGHSSVSYTLTRLRVEETPDDRGNRRLVLISTDGHRYRLHERNLLPAGHGRIVKAIVKRIHGSWTISIQLCETVDVPKPTGDSTGIDLGFHLTAATSEGNLYESRNLSAGQQRRLNARRAKLKTMTPGSNNYRKLEAKIDLLLNRRRRIQENWHHQISSEILGRHLPPELRPAEVVVDFLNFTQIANRGHKKVVMRDNLYQLHLKLRIKAEWLGIKFTVADKWFPSSKACHRCGYVRSRLTEADRVYICPRCGFRVDRDMNAALNLRDYQRDWETQLWERNGAWMNHYWKVVKPQVETQLAEIRRRYPWLYRRHRHHYDSQVDPELRLMAKASCQSKLTPQLTDYILNGTEMSPSTASADTSPESTTAPIAPLGRGNRNVVQSDTRVVDGWTDEDWDRNDFSDESDRKQ